MPARRRLLIAVLTLTLAACSAPVSGTAVRGDTTPPPSTVAVPSPSVPTPSSSVPTPTPSSGPAPTSGSTTVTTDSLPSTSAPSTPTSSSGDLSTRPPPVPSTTAGPTRATRPTPSVQPTRPTQPTATAAGFPLCPRVPVMDASGTVACVRASVSQFWSGELNEAVDQAVIVNPAAAKVPAACRSALTSQVAFTCQVNDTVYLTSLLLSQLTKEFPAREVPYALATVVGHEIGHVVQAAVRQPGYDDTSGSQAISQRIEQQADCLDGVWAHSAVTAGRLDSATFVRVSRTFLTGISSNAEIYTHGTPDQRVAALYQGLRAGRPQDCGLATFS